MDILSRPRPTERSARGTAPHVRTCVRAFSYTPNVRTLFPPVPPRMRCASTARLSFGFASGCDMKNIYPRDPWVSIGRRTLDHTVYPHTHTHTAHSKQTKTKNTKHKTKLHFRGKSEIAQSRPRTGKGKERKKYHRCVDPCVPYPIDELKLKTCPFLRYEQSDMWSFVGDARIVRAIDRSIDRGSR
jgi:hypothetical protein